MDSYHDADAPPLLHCDVAGVGAVRGMTVCTGVLRLTHVQERAVKLKWIISMRCERCPNGAGMGIVEDEKKDWILRRLSAPTPALSRDPPSA